MLDMHRKVLLNWGHLVGPELGMARSDMNVKQLLLVQPISFSANSSPLPLVYYTATEWMIFGVREQNDALIYHHLNCSTKFMLWKTRNVKFLSHRASLCCVPLDFSLLPKNQHRSYTIQRSAYSKKSSRYQDISLSTGFPLLSMDFHFS